MRFSSLAALAAAIAVLPFVVAVSTPMEGGAFVQSARCAAYENIAGQAGFNTARVNAEARRQSAPAAHVARTAIANIAEQARVADAATLHGQRAAACGGVL